MAAKPIPDGYHAVTPYLVATGATRLVDFLKQAFGAEETFRMPAPDGSIMHVEVRIGDSMIMLGEGSEQWTPMPCALCLYVENADAVYKRALQAGATSIMEPVDQFYGDRQGGVKDPSGNTWWIATHKEDLSPDELKRRGEEYMKQKQQT